MTYISFPGLGIEPFHLERVAAVADTGIVNHSRYRVRSVPAAGALLKAEDSDEKQLELL